jgi:hypothetical protein
VDTYHTCFVLKNLFKVRLLAPECKDLINDAIERGFMYYLNRLFDERGRPIPFAIKPRMVLYTYDSYDLAESVGLLSLLEKELERLRYLLAFAADEFQTTEGWFRFRLYRFLPVKGIAYMRYANSAMFLALTHALLMFQQRSNDGATNR